MTLRIFPDLYRVNSRQRDTLLWLNETGQLGESVTVSRLARGRVSAADREGRAFLLDPDGAWTLPNSR